MNIFSEFRGRYESKFRKMPKCCKGNGSTMPKYVKSVVKEFEKFQNIELKDMVGMHWRWNKKEVMSKEKDLQKFLGLKEPLAFKSLVLFGKNIWIYLWHRDRR